MLMNHANPLVNSVGRRIDGNFFAVDKNFAFIRLVKTVKDIHQGRFTGTVFSEQCQDFAFVEGKINMIVG